MGRASWIASSTERSSSVRDGIRSSKLEPDFDEVFFERGQVDDVEAGLLFDALDRRGDLALVFRGDDEPHVEMVASFGGAGTFVVVGDAFEAVDEFRDLLEA